MKVSRPTFTRVYEKARRTLSTALVEGKALLIEGGNFQTNDCWNRCEGCSKLFVCSDAKAVCPFCHKSTVRRLNPDSSTTETNGYCICTRCNTKVAHVRGKPCREIQCPSCGARMVRENCPSIKTKNEKPETKNIKVISIAKRNKDLYIEGKNSPILLKLLPREVYNLVLQLDDEAHRFAITYHKKLRSNDLLK